MSRLTASVHSARRISYSEIEIADGPRPNWLTRHHLTAFRTTATFSLTAALWYRRATAVYDLAIKPLNASDF